MKVTSNYKVMDGKCFLVYIWQKTMYINVNLYTTK